MTQQFAIKYRGVVGVQLFDSITEASIFAQEKMEYQKYEVVEWDADRNEWMYDEAVGFDGDGDPECEVIE